MKTKIHYFELTEYKNSSNTTFSLKSTFQRWEFIEPDKILYKFSFIWMEYYSGMSWGM